METGGGRGSAAATDPRWNEISPGGFSAARKTLEEQTKSASLNSDKSGMSAKSARPVPLKRTEVC